MKTYFTGHRFYHARVLAEDGGPQLYEVSRIARGTVYYRPVYEDGPGKPDCCPIEEFPRWSRAEGGRHDR